MPHAIPSVPVRRPRKGLIGGSDRPALSSRPRPVVASVHAASEPRVVPAVPEPDTEVASHPASVLHGGDDGPLPVPLHVDEQNVERLAAAALNDALDLLMKHGEPPEPRRSPPAPHGASAIRPSAAAEASANAACDRSPVARTLRSTVPAATP